MDPANTSTRALPPLSRPIGVLNLLVGASLLLGSAWLAYVMVPFLLENAPFQIEPAHVQGFVEGINQELLIDLSAKEKQASTPEQRAKLAEERKKIVERNTKVTNDLDFPAINRDLAWLSTYFWIDVASSPLLNLLLLVSGVGLIGRWRWGRALALGVVAIKIIRLVLLTILLAGWVIPGVERVLGRLGNSEAGRGVLESILRLVNDNFQANVTLSASEVVDLMAWVGYGSAVLLLGFGTIYPAIVLLVLTRSPRKVEDTDSKERKP